MDDKLNLDNMPQRPRRRKRTRQDIIKEVYLPGIIACVTMLLIIVFIIGSITRAIQHNRYDKAVAKQEAIAAQRAQEKLNAEASSISAQANSLAEKFDYRSAINVINDFSGDLTQYPELLDKLSKYEQAMENLVLWDDPSSVLSLSFHVLIADGQRAFADTTYGSKYRSNFITTTEFRNLLLELYENQYILVNLKDISHSGGMQLYLPEGKKPLIITQTNINYYRYMTDSDGDKLPDAGGAGFASRLIIDANDNISCEMVDTNGQTITGQFDMVPILESFIETHPDFSYCNAKAVLAVTGYDGIFGYRTNPDAATYLENAEYQRQIEEATALCRKLESLGYELACYTYDNTSYGNNTADNIQSDLDRWNNEVAPILGATNILVYAQNSDIAGIGSAYSGNKYDILHNNGFKYFLGFCNNSDGWCFQGEDYTRIGRILITGSGLTGNRSLYKDFFDPQTILDPVRNY